MPICINDDRLEVYDVQLVLFSIDNRKLEVQINPSTIPRAVRYYKDHHV
jgi:hypothetical protein